jgi:hypothetical protein
MVGAVERDGTFTARSDLYMLGVMLQEAGSTHPGCISLRDELLSNNQSVEQALQHTWFKRASPWVAHPHTLQACASAWVSEVGASTAWEPAAAE